MRKLTKIRYVNKILTQLSDIERDLKARCEHSTNEVEGDKWSKHHDNIQSLIKDLLAK